jgi:hypothetical protein
MSEKPPAPSTGQLEFNFAPEVERQSQLSNCKNILHKIIGSENKYADKSVQIIQLALKYLQGENACREVYKEKVGVSFRGFADGHGYDELVQGILNPEIELERIRKIDDDNTDPTDKGLWTPKN